MSDGADIGALLAETAWMHALARRLAADPGAADDLAQDTWVAALERRPRADRPLRAWLATVLRRRNSDLKRELGARERSDREAARSEALPSTHEVVERAAVQRALVEAVLELDEPYRTTVLLRFFEGLKQREIAQRMQTTTATVNSRLTRALETLRERLARGGGRGAWLQALLPLLREPAGVSVVSIGVPLMKLAGVAVLAVTIVLGVAWWRASPTDPDARRVSADDTAERARPRGSGATSEAGAGLAPSDTDAPRSALHVANAMARGSRDEQPAAALAAAARLLRGRVLDAFGNGLSGVELAADGAHGSPETEPAARCTSGAGGWFEVRAPASVRAIVAADERYATVLAGLAPLRDETRALVVVAPRIEFAGRVVDESGAPVAGAEVELELPAGFGTEWGIALDYSVAQQWSARSALDGRFQLGGVPALAAARLRASCGAYEPCSQPAPIASFTEFVIVLRASRASDGIVRGTVVDARGVAVPGARVAARGETTLTREDGSFALDVAAADVRPPLCAVKAGFLPARFDPPRDERGALRWPSTIVLRLGGAPGVLRGRVIDAEGASVAGAKVWLDDPTPFGRLGRHSIATETFLRGDERFWSFAVTADDGTFTLDGVLDRAYRVRALDPVSLVQTERVNVRAADSPLELELPTRDVVERVAGRVVSRGGLPVPGVAVRLLRKTLEVELVEGRQNDAQEGSPRITGANGEFEFERVPKAVSLLVTGDDILFAGTSLEREADLSAIEIRVSVRLHLQVELDAPRERADGFRVLDAAGQPLVLNVMAGEGAHFGPRMPLVDGLSAVVALDEGATTLVLEKGDREVGRKTLHLGAGTPNRVRF